MQVARRWSALSRTQRRLVLAGATLEGAAKVAALVDLARRPATQVRGPKWVWAAVLALVNAFGGAPLAYYRFGRRRAG